MSEKMRSEILGVLEAADAVYFTCIDYVEALGGEGSGAIYRAPDKRMEEGEPELVLGAPDMLTRSWISPEGHLWVAGVTGKVACTAAWPWAAVGQGLAAGHEQGGGLKWVVTCLPAVRSTGLPPNVTALWGTSDTQVLAGTTGGHIYAWDGRQWQQVVDGPGRGEGTILAIGGVGPKDVYALGQGSTVLHFDGQHWQPLPVPGAPNGHENFNGVVVLGDGSVLISGNGKQGRLLQGTSQGLVEFGRYDIQLIGMAALDARVLFATGDGCAELIGRDVQMLKDSFDTVSIFPGRGRVTFIEPEQASPSYIDYDPGEADVPWWRQEF